MKKLQGIAISKEAPQTNMLWLGSGNAKYFNNGKWNNIGGSDIPVASSTELGGIKIGFIKKANNYPLKVDNSNNGYITVEDVTTSNSGLMTVPLLQKLNGIAANANNYVLPKATTNNIGGVKMGIAISDITETTDPASIASTVNSLLAILREIGLISK